MLATEVPFSLAEILAEAGRQAAEPLWIGADGPKTWGDFGRMIETARRECTRAGMEPGAIVVAPGETTLESLAWLLAVALAGGIAMPLRHERLVEVAAWSDFCRIDWRVEEGRLVARGTGTLSATATRLVDELRARGHPGLILATGGTTGVPKLVLHDLVALLATVPLRPGQAWRTLPLMRFDHIGGLDMAWRALAGRQVLVAPPADLAPDAVAATIARHRVEVMPATPSFLNLLLLSEAPRRHDFRSLRIVPYGAEPMPAGLLARLRAALPAVQFVQRFGTSETGALPVRDVGEGLELKAGSPGFDWKVVGDELWVRSPARALGYLAGDADCFDAEGWFRTGDVVEQMAGGSLRVLGRRKEMINVGGEKVLPAAVEGLLLTHPQVADCRVHPLPNAVLGQVVAAEVVWRGATRDPLAVKAALHQFATDSLPKSHLPAVVKLVESVETTGNMKKQRQTNP